MSRDLAAMGGFTVTPDCFGELICCSDDLHAVGAAGREKLPACFLMALLDSPLRLEAGGVVRFLSARIRPWAVGRLLAAAAPGPSLSTRGWIDAAPVLGSRLDLVAEMISRLDWTSASEVLEQSLLDEVGRWKLGKLVQADSDMGMALVEPFLGEEPRPTAAIAGEQATTKRQVERRVRALTGTSPKQLASLSRFQRARDAIWADPSTDLARLAIDAGYSDQPHLTREFRRYAGQTPARFARESAERKRWLSKLVPDVAFVQEPPAPRR
jgi:AraC-like DNA-binding protein